MANWVLWALASAVFAALTAILGKIGVESVDSDLATLIRTAVVIVLLAFIVVGTGAYRKAGAVGSRSFVFLVLSGLATGASWLCYYRALKLGPASRVAPIDKMSVVLVSIFAVAFLHERLSVSSWMGVLLIGMGGVLLSLQR